MPANIIYRNAPACAQCKAADGVIQFVAICERGRLEVQEAWLHAACENDYLAVLDRERG